jgi:hypothetical protein
MLTTAISFSEKVNKKIQDIQLQFETIWQKYAKRESAAIFFQELKKIQSDHFQSLEQLTQAFANLHAAWEKQYKPQTKELFYNAYRALLLFYEAEYTKEFIYAIAENLPEQKSVLTATDNITDLQEIVKNFLVHYREQINQMIIQNSEHSLKPEANKILAMLQIKITKFHEKCSNLAKLPIPEFTTQPSDSQQFLETLLQYEFYLAKLAIYLNQREKSRLKLLIVRDNTLEMNIKAVDSFLEK